MEWTKCKKGEGIGNIGIGNVGVFVNKGGLWAEVFSSKSAGNLDKLLCSIYYLK